MKKKILYVVNVDWFFTSHRLPLAIKAIQQGYEVHLATHITQETTQLKQAGIIIHPLSFSRSSLNIFGLISFYLQLKKIFISLQPDILHLVTIKPVLVGCIVARVTKVPAVVAAISGLGFLFTDQGIIASIKRFLAGMLYKFSLRHPNLKVIFQNTNDQEVIERYVHLTSQEISLIEGSGVDLQHYSFEPLPKGIPIILCPTRLLQDKGVLEFVEAAKNLHAKNISARFVLVGNLDADNPASISKNLVDEWVDEGIVEYWGFQQNMSRVLGQSSIVVLASYREGFPKILMEAAAKGRPIITTDVPGCRTAIINGVTGVLVPSKNSIILAKHINDLLGSPKILAKMGLKGRQLAESNFDQEIINTKQTGIYHTLLSGIN